MTSIVALLLAYVIGGLTLLPGLAFFLFRHGRSQDQTEHSSSSKVHHSLDHASNASCSAEATAQTEPELAASYFRVCRHLDPVVGMITKQQEAGSKLSQSSTAGTSSIYQNMYRNVFNRVRPEGDIVKPTEVSNSQYYIVLRHGHLILFDNADQIDVRHVIALRNFLVELHGSLDESPRIPEGELYVKRNCIKLTERSDLGEAASGSLPYYLFAKRATDKEDFYHALLQAQRSILPTSQRPAGVLHFETEDMISLIRQLHTSEESSQTRWLNALLGRIFLAVYKTANFELLLKEKIARKLLRMSRPSFLSSLNLESIDVGHSAPMFSSMKLKEMNIDGSLTIETDVRYSGLFRLVATATARIDLGSRFKMREVDLVLSGTLRKIQGHLLIHIKPPPSNRIWLTFEQMPVIDMLIEPVVSSRQMNYSIITRAIESRVKEVFQETLVLPNWDDVPFFDTVGGRRGGIWTVQDTTGAAKPSSIHDGHDTCLMDDVAAPDPRPRQHGLPDPGKWNKAEELYEKRLEGEQMSRPIGASSCLEISANSIDRPSTEIHDQSSGSFASACAAPALPKSTTDFVIGSANSSKPRRKPIDALGSMSSISTSAVELLAIQSTMENKQSQDSMRGDPAADALHGREENVEEVSWGNLSNIQAVTSAVDSSGFSTLSSSKNKHLASTQSLAAATLAAKRWGSGVIYRSGDKKQPNHNP